MITKDEKVEYLKTTSPWYRVDPEYRRELTFPGVGFKMVAYLTPDRKSLRLGLLDSDGRETSAVASPEEVRCFTGDIRRLLDVRSFRGDPSDGQSDPEGA